MLSRRDFLKLSGAALLGLFFPFLQTPSRRSASHLKQGRVLYARMKVRAEPSFSSDQIGSLAFDNLVAISGEVTGGVPEDINRLWFRLQSGGYVHSTGIQLVRARLNETILDLPATGVVGGITVPYADSQWAINHSPAPGPRLYYQSTHWVTGLVTDERDGSLWYKCYDNLWQSHYYTHPQWVHIYTDVELAPLTPHIADFRKHIEIILDEQMLYAFEDDRLVYLARTSTGQPGYETPTGWFRTFHKRPTYHMTGGYDLSSTYDLPGVPWDTYITESGIAIHGTFWHNDFGTPHSHGCINLAPDAARWVYRWTSPPVPAGGKVVVDDNSGTRVRVLKTRVYDPWRNIK